MKPNLILAGPTGVGKTSVGRFLAKRLQMQFLDFDSEIEHQFGMHISQIFAQHGEQRFRDAETKLCRSLLDREGVVAATGGGAVVREENRAILHQAGALVCLTCTPEELLERLTLHGGIEVRPLLRDNPEANLRRLLEARKLVYDSIPLRVDTTNLTLEQVAASVRSLYKKYVANLAGELSQA